MGDCPPVEKYWKYVEANILNTFDTRIHLPIVDVLLKNKECLWKGQNQTN